MKKKRVWILVLVLALLITGAATAVEIGRAHV